MSELDVFLALGVVTLVAIGVTKFWPRVEYSRRLVIVVTALVIMGGAAVMVLSLSHGPKVGASGILHD